MAWHDKINSKQLCSSRPPCTINHHRLQLPLSDFQNGWSDFFPCLTHSFVSSSFTPTPSLVCFSLTFFLHFPLSVCPLTSCSWTQGWSFTFQLSAGSLPRWHSLQPCVQKRGGVWGSFRTVSLSTWANRKREAGEMLVGKPSTNWLGGGSWQSDS